MDNESNKDIDIVPHAWLTFDKSNEIIFCKYMPPPYGVRKFRQLQNMVVNCDEPLSSWSEYPVELRGRARKSYFIFLIYVYIYIFFLLHKLSPKLY